MPQPLLEGYVEPDSPVAAHVARLEERIADLEARLESGLEQVTLNTVVVVLNLLGKSMKHVASGEFDLDDIPIAAEQPSKWNPIKARLAPRLAEAIDIFLAQGSLKRTQLAAAMRMDYSNCTKNVIAILVRQGLLIERGGQLSLKEL